MTRSRALAGGGHVAPGRRPPSSCCSASTAPRRRMTTWRSGKIPTTSVWRRNSLLSRSSGLLLQTWPVLLGKGGEGQHVASGLSQVLGGGGERSASWSTTRACLGPHTEPSRRDESAAQHRAGRTARSPLAAAVVRRSRTCPGVRHLTTPGRRSTPPRFPRAWRPRALRGHHFSCRRSQGASPTTLGSVLVRFEIRMRAGPAGRCG